MAMVNDTRLAEVRFPVTAGLVATMLVGVMSLIYWMASGSVEELVVFVAASTAAAGAILTAFHSARSLALTAGALRKEEEQRNKEMAFRLTAKWNDPTMFHVRDTIRALFVLDHKSEEFKASIRAKETNVIHFLNFLEEVGIAIEKGGADPAVLKEAYGGVVLKAWGKLQDWVKDQRAEYGQPRIWIYVEDLAKKWN
jgi:hypothetical protein